VRIEGRGAIVLIDKASGLISFLSAGGQTRIVEAPPPPPMTGVPVSKVQAFTIGATEALHGLGQFREPRFDYRDRDVFLAHANSDATNPFLVSTGGWGVLWDTGTSAHFQSSGRSLAFHASAGEVIRYHVTLGADMDGVIGGYRRLTGQAPLFGKWAYGYWQSKERYDTQAELTAVVDRYRDLKLPLDNIVLDWRYWGENDNFSGMTFDAVRFPDPKGMVDHVHAQGAHIIASVWPAFGPKSAIYKDLEREGLLFKGQHWSGGKVFDASSPKARGIYWKHAKAGLIDVGIDGFWTDGIEPEFMSTGDRYGAMASFAANGQSTAGPISENLLTYSYYQSKGLYEAMKRDNPSKRPFILTRSVYAGQQAFGSTTWSGDIFASWQTLRNQVIAGQNLSMSGVPYWTCDIGGFLVNHRYPDGLDDPAYKELYVRWFQFGAFLPIFRAHGTNIPREIWQFGAPGEPVYDALADALRLRYALTPYVYANAAAVTQDGDTMLRGLMMDFPDDAKCRDTPSQFMFGRQLMVRVVDRPLEHASANIQEFLPSDAVRGLDAPAAKLEFFEGTDFGKPVFTRLTEDLKMSWFGDLPDVLRGKPYSARWTGQLIAQETGAHTLVVMAKGGLKMTFDGKLVVDGKGQAVKADGADGGVSFKEHAGDDRYEVEVQLVKGRGYRFVIEQRQATPDAVSLWVEWITPSLRRLAQIPERKTVEVYLPRGGDWYDFKTHQRLAGGGTVEVDAPIGHLPIYARAGAIIPMTPGIQRAQERAEQIEIKVFAGADGAFSLYDDEGDGHGYQSDAFAKTPLRWSDRDRTLAVGPRRGAYPGMAAKVNLAVTVIDGQGRETAHAPVSFDGTAMVLNF
jgi:alpha-D-xyloside xylohydrolase